MGHLKKGAVVLGAASALLVATGGTAWAGQSAVIGGAAVVGSFNHKTDAFTVCDVQSDGFNVYLDYEYTRIDGSDQEGRHYVSTGAGTCRTFDHNFGEGRTVRFSVCQDLPLFTPDPCTDWAVGIA